MQHVRKFLHIRFLLICQKYYSIPIFCIENIKQMCNVLCTLPPADDSVPKGKVYISMKVPDICLQYEHMYVLDVPKVSNGQ